MFKNIGYIVQVDYTAWAYGEPNGNFKENCAGIWPTITGDWNDYDCNDSHAYICKTKTGTFLEFNPNLHVKFISSNRWFNLKSKHV